MVVEFLKTGINESFPLSFLVLSFLEQLYHDFLTKYWIVRIIHVYKEANCLTDELANYDSISSDVASFLENDIHGLVV